jgi:hypothetical protein
MLLVALLLESTYLTVSICNASVERALAACEIVRGSLEDCMGSKGYVPINGDEHDEPEGWQSQWVHRLLDDSFNSTPWDDTDE